VTNWTWRLFFLRLKTRRVEGASRTSYDPNVERREATDE
jgi:hypothetical protein